MSRSDEPPRLLDDPEVGDELRAVLRAGRDELPDPHQLMRLAATLGPLMGPGGGAGGGSGGAGGGSGGAGGGSGGAGGGSGGAGGGSGGAGGGSGGAGGGSGGAGGGSGGAGGGNGGAGGGSGGAGGGSGGAGGGSGGAGGGNGGAGGGNGGAGGGSGGAGGASGVAGTKLVGGAASKIVAGLVLVAGVGGGALLWNAAGSPPERASTAVETAPSPPQHEQMPELPAGLDLPDTPAPELEEVAPEQPVHSRPVRPRRAPAEEPAAPATEPSEPAHEVDPAAELALIRRAQDTLAADPARALALTDEHLRRFGDGMLAQEREVVAIDALVRLGRLDTARARAARFHQRWPRSAHGRRVDVMLAR